MPCPPSARQPRCLLHRVPACLSACLPALHFFLQFPTLFIHFHDEMLCFAFLLQILTVVIHTGLFNPDAKCPGKVVAWTCCAPRQPSACYAAPLRCSLTTFSSSLSSQSAHSTTLSAQCPLPRSPSQRAAAFLTVWLAGPDFMSFAPDHIHILLYESAFTSLRPTQPAVPATPPPTAAPLPNKSN